MPAADAIEQWNIIQQQPEAATKDQMHALIVEWGLNVSALELGGNSGIGYKTKRLERQRQSPRIYAWRCLCII